MPEKPNAYAVAFGAKLRDLREQAGLTAAQVAEAVGVSRPRVWEYENGKRVPSVETADRLAVAVGASLADFAGLAKCTKKVHNPFDCRTL